MKPGEAARSPVGRSMGLTRDGWLALGLVSAATVVATASGNNLIQLLVAGGWSLLLVGVGLGSWNLRNVSVHRVLPADLFADVEAVGRLVVRNDRRWLPAFGLEVADGAGAEAQVACVPPQREASGSAVWCFPRRGVATLDMVSVRSTFPFGLVRHVAASRRPVEVVVYPCPAATRGRAVDGELGGDAADGRSRGRGGDFAGLRAYAPGDRPSAVHWPSTARVGHVVVVQGTGEVETRIDVVVRDRGDRERELSRAAGEVLDAFERGLRVGLVVAGFDGAPAQRHPPDSGASWRRELLEVLARVPEQP